MRNTKRGKHDHEFFIRPSHLCLRGHLRGDFISGQAVAGKNRQFLSAHERVQSIDRGNADLDKFGWVITRVGIDRLAVDVEKSFGNNGRRAAAPVKCTRVLSTSSPRVPVKT